jgi:uncharacterized protein (TIGR03067 family)
MNAQRFIPVLVVLCPLLVAAADDAEPKGDLAKFQGRWKMMVGPEKNFPIALLIKGKTATVSGSTPDGQDFQIKGEIKLDDAAKPFRTIDWVKFAGPEGNDLPENKGIYELVDRDTIKVCNGGPGKDRPTVFKEGEAGSPDVTLLKREKN